jgi:hypothetical protein
MMMFCSSIFLNEQAKYRSCLKEDEQLAEQYNEFSCINRDLIAELSSVMTARDVA